MLPAESLTERTVRAARWQLAASATSAVSQFAIGILLARLLTPADFGLIALAVVVLTLGQTLGDLGISNALVQRRALTDRHVRAAFTFSVLLGIGIAIVLIFAAPVAASAMREPRVIPLAQVLAVGFALRGVSLVGRALLTRQLNFRRLFFIDVCSHIIGYGCVAITLALLGYGVWSLVWGDIVQGLMASAAQLASARHSMQLLLARRELAELLHVGVGAHLNGCVNYVALNADNFVIGRILGPASLGLYVRAYALMNIPLTHGARVMTSVLFPALSRVQNDMEVLRRAFLLVTKLTAMIAAPAMVTLGVLAPHLIPSVYGSQWVGVVVPLQILCAAGYFRALYHLDGVIVQSIGWVYKEFWRQCGYAALVIAGSLLGSHYGLAGIATGVGVAIAFMFVALGQLALRATDVRWRIYLVAQGDALITAAVTFTLALSLRFWLEALDASSSVITVTVLSASAIPWSLGILWTLGLSDFHPLRQQLPRGIQRLSETLRGRRPIPDTKGNPLSTQQP